MINHSVSRPLPNFNGSHALNLAPTTPRGADAPPEAKKKREFIPPGYKNRLQALWDVIGFGPALLPTCEFLALLFHTERSLRFNKGSDRVSLARMTGGIHKKEKTESPFLTHGAWLRLGSGQSMASNARGNKGLVAKGLLRITHHGSKKHGNEQSGYEIQWPAVKAFFEAGALAANTPLLQKLEKGASLKLREGLLSNLDKYSVGSSSSEIDVSVHEHSSKLEGSDGHRGSRKKKALEARKTPKTPEQPKPEPSVKKNLQTHRSDDDDGQKPEPKMYISPKDELIGLVREKYGEKLSIGVLHRLETAFSLQGATWADFLDVVRLDLERGELKRPIGFLTTQARAFRAAATCPEPAEGEPAKAPPTPPERCPLCGEVKGKGLRLIGNEIVPCECATPEYIREFQEKEAERARKIQSKPQAGLAQQEKHGGVS